MLSKKGPYEQTPGEWLTIWRIASNDANAVFAVVEKQMYSQGWAAWWTTTSSGEFEKGNEHVSMDSMSLQPDVVTLVIANT